ncbi:LysR family transcriptional regulator [Sagittula stellata]|uniref:Probable transcriptional regulator transcription regulator protein n=1 Tax=Sagittula stellata (strain ATCC 700073 / DSM 11524 / E-37) TaxID=388399 RepID=A3K263_SAGS3|nr:LysR family transcriptional regulator [Sagittula stellata]EBA09009.1 probable transcriptional regulator transcription regulator protein [Sagittula stellata E-37]
MENWDDLRFLVALARTGTMKAAAMMLGTNTATVSRRIDRLSEALGEAAFVKTPGGWQPSEAVKDLIQVAQTFDGQIQTALHAKVGKDTAPVRVKLGAVPFIARHILIPGMGRYNDLLDGIELHLTDRFFKDGLGDHDIVVQLNRPADGRVVTRRIGRLAARLYRPVDVPEPQHWAGYSARLDNVSFQRFGFDAFDKPPKVRLSGADAVAGVIKSAGYAGPLPDVIGLHDPELVVFDPDSPPHIIEVWMFYHETRRDDPVIRNTVDYVLGCFQDNETTLSERAAAE